MKVSGPSTPATLQDDNARLVAENSILRTDIGYWKNRHEKAVEREVFLKKELQDKNARIKYLTRQLYQKKTEHSRKSSESTGSRDDPKKRKRGQQPDYPHPKRRDQSHLPTTVEDYDLQESEQYCSSCGLPFKGMPDTEDSEVLETQEVSGYRRVIRRKKYTPGCSCPGNKGIITAPGPPKLFAGRYGASIWIHILIRKYRFQIPVARILKNLALHGLSIPPGSAGDGLKKLAPLFEPVYAAIEDRSRQADWWQADETRWSVFETTQTKSTFRWYLWVFISQVSVVHIIDPTRSAQVIEDHLGELINGILLVDRYSAYKSYAKKHEGIILAFCWAHVRRDFRDAGLKFDQIRVWALEWEERINLLFHLNHIRVQYAPHSPEFLTEDARVREKVAKIRDVLDAERKIPHLHHSQKSLLKSLDNHWEGLTIFIEHPEIPMDNNGSERILRNPVVGRKNYYGSGAIWSARFTAVMFSIFETLQLWDINQVQWLSDYFRSCALNGGNAPEDISSHLPWNIKEKKEATWKYKGRVFSQGEIDLIRSIIDEDTTRSRSAISKVACEQLVWYRPDGSLKTASMSEVLVKMEADGHFTLPVPRKSPRLSLLKPIEHTHRTEPEEELLLPVGKLPPLRLEIAEEKIDRSLWNEYIDRYHYLGLRNPLPGAQMKYFAYAGDRLVALLGFGASAWRVAPRDWYIGWNDEQRVKNLHLVINNARFLILPWICSKNLASKVLSLAAGNIADDWQNRYKYKPVLLETFVEKQRFSGTCYKAANWKHVGTTQGRGKKDILNNANLPKKEIFMYPLDKNFQAMLC